MQWLGIYVEKDNDQVELTFKVYVLMKNMMTAFLVFMIATNISAQSNWKEKSDKDGIKVYTRELDDSALDEFKGVTVIHASINDIETVLRDVPNMVQWVPNCIISRIIELNDEMQIHYVAYDAPWPASGRDSYVQYKLVQEGKNLKIYFNGLPDYGPELEDFVRVPQITGFWLLEPISASKTRVTYQVSADPGGSVPTWLANAGAVDTPYNTIKGLRKRIETLKK